MRNNLYLIILLPIIAILLFTSIFFGIQAHDRKQTINDLQIKLQQKNATRTKVKTKQHMSVKIKKGQHEKTIICPICEGKKELVLQETRRKQSIYPCPTCKAQGTKKLELPKKTSVCSHCNGLGLRGYPPKHDPNVKQIAKICVPCTGRGWRKIR